ncbi:hypothetical protein NQ315_002944 [Exocentrus adspersus]|uniref:RNase H type-1 domain-containing protein n=1 Tax=Exocentrus adspersus TaxID=1586481 RepID=A0AAV8W4S8_9CUCU|nr:hypothetical protein NQ315_002944 [Exocentrus adspersus]
MVSRTHREHVKNCVEGRILICFDSQAALRAISSPRTRSILQECGDALESLVRQKEVGVVLVPGHIRITGNKRANQLARLGSGVPCQGLEPILEILRGSINGALSIEENSLCSECEEGEDTPVQLLWNCIAFGMLRHKVFGSGELQEEEMRGLPWTKILTLIRASGRFEEGNGRMVLVDSYFEETVTLKEESASVRSVPHISRESSLGGRDEHVLRPVGHPLLLGCSIPQLSRRRGDERGGPNATSQYPAGGEGRYGPETEPELSLAVEMDRRIPSAGCGGRAWLGMIRQSTMQYLHGRDFSY